MRLNRVLAILLAALLALMSVSVLAEDTQKLDVYYTLANKYIDREDYEKALSYIDSCFEYVEKDTNAELYADLCLRKAYILMMTQSYDECLAQLTAAEEAQPTLSGIYLIRTQAYWDMENYESALADLKKYIEMSGDVTMYEQLSQLYEALGDYDNALVYYNMFTENNSVDTATAAFQQGVYLMNLSDYENALASFNETVASGVSFDGLNYNMGLCKMMLGDLEGAIEGFTASIETESYVALATFNRARAYMSNGEYALAEADFTAYIGDGEDATTAVNVDAETGAPIIVTDTANYYRGLCRMLCLEFDLAAEDFTKCIENEIVAEDSLFNRGLSYLQGGSYENAKADLTTCIETENDPITAAFYRAYANAGLGLYEEAIADFTTCIENEYDLATTYYERAQCYDLLGMDDEYIADLEASLNY